ncbi:putative plastidic glucose transporter 1 [Quercus suber]|uniref:Plastidic glucose transporter 1 n=1 Tax=Quercus suber TaxID=58331 RepID=A0AAW0MCJ2_QUESU
MWVNTVHYQLVDPVPATLTSLRNPNLLVSFPNPKTFRFLRLVKFKALAAKKQQLTKLETRKPESENFTVSEKNGDEVADYGWLPAFPHVLIASMSNFLFGYHIGVMNGPIVSIARELGFEGNSILEGLVVSIFIVGAFVGSISSGSLVDRLGCRRTFQIVTIPLILGAILSAQAYSLDEVLLGRFLVGLGIGVNTVLVPIYISEVLLASIMLYLQCSFLSNTELQVTVDLYASYNGGHLK